MTPVAGVAKEAGTEVAIRSNGLALPGVEFTATGLRIEGGISFANWSRLLAFLEHLSGATPWWIGDAIAHGEREFGEAFAQAVGGRSSDSMRQYAWVSERIPPDRRRAGLSWSAHRVVAALEPDEADALLDQAERERLGSKDLRSLVSGRRAADQPEEVVSITLTVTRVTLARLHSLADGRPLGEVVAELVSDGT